MTLGLSNTLINGWQLIGVDGQIDSKSVNELRDFLDREIIGGCPIALELTSVQFMSSAGLRTLLTLHRQTKSAGVALALVGLKEEIANTMKVTGFYQYFTIYASTKELPLQPPTQPPAEARGE